MRAVRRTPSSWNGGELSPEMYSRPDDIAYQNGAERILNFVVNARGALQRRPGFQFVAKNRTQTRRARGIPFRSGTSAVLLELGQRDDYPAVAAVPGYVRFHSLGQPLLYAVAWSAAMAYAVGNRVVSGAVLYECVQAHTNQVPPNLTYWRSLEYVQRKAFATTDVDTTNNWITIAGGHGFETGDPIAVSGSPGVSSPPSPLQHLVTYYAIKSSSTRIKFATTRLNAVGGAAIDLLTVGTGTNYLFQAHQIGDIVSASGVFYYSVLQWPSPASPTLSVDPGSNEAYWYTLAATGELEMPLDLQLDDTELFAVTHSQQGDTLTLAHRKGMHEISIADGVRWTVAPVAFGSKLLAPANVAVVADPGGTIGVASVQPYVGSPSGVGAIKTKSLHGLYENDPVYVTGLSQAGYPDGRYLVGYTWVVTSDSYLRLKQIDQATDIAFWSLAATLTNGAANITITGHPLQVGDTVQFTGIGGGVSNVSNNVTYYVAAKATNTVQISASSTLSPIITVAGGSSGATAFRGYTGNGRIRSTSLSNTGTNVYLVLAVDSNGAKGPASSQVTIENLLAVPGASNTVTWDAVAGAARYHIYKKGSGIFGYIGAVDAGGALSFKDDNIAPDLSETVPITDTSLAATSPAAAGAVCHFEGRRAFGGSTTYQQDVWLTRVNDDNDLSYNLPLQDDDRIHHTLNAAIPCTIRHLVSIDHLWALTDTCEVRITPMNSDALTPTSFRARPYSYIGAGAAAPEIVNAALVYAAASGGHVRVLGLASDSYLNRDLSQRAAHLFDNRTVWQFAQSRGPTPVVWAVSSSGRLLGCTFMPEQDLIAWHQTSIDGDIESVCVLPEGDEDRVYVFTKRTLAGVVTRCVERMGAMAPSTDIGARSFLDCSVSRTGSPSAVVTGLAHLEGVTVSILADGKVQKSRTVVGGQITLDASASAVHVGLPYTSELLTVPATVAIEGYGTARMKVVGRVWFRVEGSARFQIGTTETDLATVTEIPTGALYSGTVRMLVPSRWTEDGQLLVRQSDPLPLTLVSMTPEIGMGD